MNTREDAALVQVFNLSEHPINIPEGRRLAICSLVSDMADLAIEAPGAKDEEWVKDATAINE